MIGFLELQSGRMGNRLFHYHFLRQVSDRLSLDYFHPKLQDSALFLEMGAKRRPLFRRSIAKSIDANDLKSLSLEEIANASKGTNDLVLKPPILGDFFFDFLFKSPAEFVNLRGKYKTKPPIATAKSMVALHFRGGDFREWNKRAILPIDYYIQAMESCEKDSKKEVSFFIFTDDLQLESYLGIKKYFVQNSISFHEGNRTKSAAYDFHWMTQSDYLISTPSTYAIWAGCLGRSKKIIHNLSWLKYSIEKNDLFWVKLSETQNSYYRLWKAM